MVGSGRRWISKGVLALNYLLGLSLLVLGLAGCREQSPRQDYVARVGTSYLTQEQVRNALEALPTQAADSADVRRQVVEQWITNELLYQEALRRDIRNDEAVQRRLEESERAVLIDALVTTLYAEDPPSVNNAEVRSYFERRREQLRLREPFVRVRHLWTSDPDSAAAARALVHQLNAAGTIDSLWAQVAMRFASDTAYARDSDQNYLPESRLFIEQAALHTHLRPLRPGDVAPVIAMDSTWHVVQLVDRAERGALPELSWVREEIVRLLTIDARKQMFQRQVQRLRTEAQSRDDIDLR